MGDLNPIRGPLWQEDHHGQGDDLNHPHHHDLNHHHQYQQAGPYYIAHTDGFTYQPVYCNTAFHMG